MLAASAMAQHWDIEKVDSAGWGAAVDMRWHPDGRLFLCYSDTAGVIRLASAMDSIWSYEDLPQWRAVFPGTQTFDIDARGTIGVSYIGTDRRYCYALKTDTGWTDIPTAFSATPSSPSLTTLDTAGAPVITIQVSSEYQLARLQDTAWVTTTVGYGYGGTNDYACKALGSTADGAIWGVYRYRYSGPAKILNLCYLYRFAVRDSDVSIVSIVGGRNVWVWAASACTDDQDSVHSVYAYENQLYETALYLDHGIIDTATAERTAVKFDSLDRPQVAYVSSDKILMYRYRASGVWHIFNLQTTGVTALNLAVDRNSEPVIAYTTSEGVFVAYGVGVTGQSERRPPTAFGPRPTASVVRNVLFLTGASSRKPQATSLLLDAAGRRALDLHPGANDVSALAPGVYFVQEKPQASSHKPQAFRKIVIAR